MKLFVHAEQMKPLYSLSPDFFDSVRFCYEQQEYLIFFCSFIHIDLILFVFLLGTITLSVCPNVLNTKLTKLQFSYEGR